MKKKLPYVLGGAAFFAALVSLSILLAISLRGEQDGPGLLHGDATEDLPPTTSSTERDTEYENRMELPESTMAAMPDTIYSYLSTGQFSQLDTRLRGWAETYKDNEDQSQDESMVIDRYRADIAYYLSLKESDPLDAWYFQGEDALVAAVAFAPVSVKYKAFINRQSALLPPATGNIEYKVADLSNEELTQLLNTINRTLTDASKFISVRVYDFTAHAHKCRFIAVETQDYLLQPYSVTVDDETFSITCSLADRIIQTNPNANLDSMFAAPAQTDPNAEPNYVPGGENSASTDNLDFNQTESTTPTGEDAAGEADGITEETDSTAEGTDTTEGDTAEPG